MIVLTLFLFAAGVYLLVNTVKMKNTGTIPQALINNKINLERAKDIPGYIKFMYPRGIAMGIALSLFSALSIYNEFSGTVNVYILFVARIGYAAALIYYSVISVKAQNKYLF